MAADANLPSGSDLAELLSDRLEGRLAGYVPPDDTRDLIAVADKAAALGDGLAALQSEVLQLADFDSAEPNYGHRALAALLAEGALRLLTWNWDDCIERAVPPGERLQAAYTQEDVTSILPPSVLKVHGLSLIHI